MLDFIHNHDNFELRELAHTVRRFGEQHLAPIGFKREHFTEMGSLGLTGMALEERYGGSQLGALAIAAVVFELARAQLGPAIYLSVHSMVSSIIQRGAREDHHELLNKLAAGSLLGAFCLTEPQAGSDASALTTRARRDGESYVLDGEKIYITSGGLADVYLVFARTGGEGGNGISAFIVKKDTPGLSFGKHEQKMGCEGAPISSVAFENCRVPASALLGKEGDGYRIALSGLNGGRVNIAAAACGISAKAIAIACEHLKQRRQFGQPLATFQGLQFMVADMAMLHHASIQLTRTAAQELDRGSAERLPASVAKCFATDSAMKITTDAVQLLGGAGYIREYGAEQLMRDAKMLQIVEGTNQIQRVLIAREFLA